MLYIPSNSTDFVFTPNGIDFNGDRVEKATSPAAANGRKGLASFWLNADVDNVDSVIYQHGNGTTNARFRIRVTNSERVEIRIKDAATESTNLLNSRTSNGSMEAADGWVHFLIAWDLTTLGAEVVQIYVNGASDRTDISAPVGGEDLEYLGVDGGAASICASADANEKFDGQISELYINFAETLDISVAGNREKFRSSGGAPVSLGSDGSIPTGNAPAVYMHNPAATFQNNNGIGGAFTVIAGTLTDVAPPP